MKWQEPCAFLNKHYNTTNKEQHWGLTRAFFFFSPQTTDEWNEENSGWVSVRVTGNVSEERDNKYRKCLGKKKKISKN